MGGSIMHEQHSTVVK